MKKQKPAVPAPAKRDKGQLLPTHYPRFSLLHGRKRRAGGWLAFIHTLCGQLCEKPGGKAFAKPDL